MANSEVYFFVALAGIGLAFSRVAADNTFVLLVMDYCFF